MSIRSWLVLLPLVEPLQTVVQVVPLVETCTSKRLRRLSPAYAATPRWLTRLTAPRSKRSHWPTPEADQRVDSLSSTVLAGTLPSWLLAVTPPAPGVSTKMSGQSGAWSTAVSS